MSLTIVSADQLEELRGMFPDHTPDSLRRVLHRHKGDLNATVEALLLEATQTTNKAHEKKDEGNKATTWACLTCTFENALGSRRCAMCDSAAPAHIPTPDPARVDPPKAQDGTAVVVAPWWDTFWAEHRSTLNCDERTAKEIVFAGGRFKNSQILTVDIKSKIYSLLGAEEVHHVAPPDNDDYGQFPAPFPYHSPYPYPHHPAFPPPPAAKRSYPHRGYPHAMG